MTTKFYIKKNDTGESLRTVMKKIEAPVEGVTPPALYYLSSQSIVETKFSMAKIPQTNDDGTITYPDGTILQTDGTIINPPANQAVLISGVRVEPGEVLNQDYSVTQTDGKVRYPNNTMYDPTTKHLTVPNNSVLLPNGMVKLPPTPAYPTGYILNPNEQDRTNYYLVPNPTENPRNPDNTVVLPPETYVDQDPDSLTLGSVVLPSFKIKLPLGTLFLSSTTVTFPSGTTKEDSASINRSNALVLPQQFRYYYNYTVTYDSNTRRYTFPETTTLAYDENNKTATVTFPDATTLEVPYETVRYDENIYVFPPSTIHIFAEKKFIFPGNTFTLPLDAQINVFGNEVTVIFPTNTIINPTSREVTLLNKPTLYPTGDFLKYDGTTVKLNTLHEVLYNGYEFYPRGTQKNSVGTIIHPSYVDEAPYIRYHPTKSHPEGLLIRQQDGALVNNDGTFTRLDNSIVDQNNIILQPAATNVPFFTQTETPPFIPVDTRSYIITINKAPATFKTVNYTYTQEETQSIKQATVLEYKWRPEDTQHVGLYSGEFEVTFADNSRRTFPIQKDDALFIEVLDHFNY